MHPPSHRATQHFLRWLIVAFTLPGFIGLLLLQGNTMPGELPGHTIHRLTGLCISSSLQAACTADEHDAPNSAMMMGHHHSHHKTPLSPDGEGCPLCPLLHLPVIILGSHIAPLSVSILLTETFFSAVQPRAPPVEQANGLPPARAPPAMMPVSSTPAG